MFTYPSTRSCHSVAAAHFVPPNTPAKSLLHSEGTSVEVQDGATAGKRERERESARGGIFSAAVSVGSELCLSPSPSFFFPCISLFLLSLCFSYLFLSLISSVLFLPLTISLCLSLSLSPILSLSLSPSLSLSLSLSLTIF